MTQPSINDSILQLINAELANSSGTFTHIGDYSIAGTLTVDTINVANLVTPSDQSLTGNWAGNLESEINGKGFNWTWGNGSTQLIYRTGGRVWTNGAFDVSSTGSYKIDDVPVLSASTLGNTIVHSNLRTVGTLESLGVSGDTALGEFAYFNSTFNRLGIGTDEPSASINILDNNVDIIIGSPSIGLAHIGTNSSHDLAIVTDNLARITVKNTGEVNVGDPVNGGGVLNVYGTLFATSVQTDNRIERTHPLQFSSTKDTSIYGLGLVWSGTGYTRQLLMASGPDRLYTSESFDIAQGQAYYINALPVLTQNSLGSSIVNSSLTTLGTLQSLSVTGTSVFMGSIDANLSTIQAQALIFNNGVNTVTLDNTGINAGVSVAVNVSTKEIIYGDNAQISIGDKTLQSKPVKVFGPLSVNVNNPDPSLQFTVNGDVSIGGKRFTSATTFPNSGIYQVGDICWNTIPQLDSFVGWVCTVSGTPGEWSGFGKIASQ